MIPVAEGISRLRQTPRPMINIYVAGDVMIDAGTRSDKRRVFKQIEGVELSLLALTHVHPDHQGVAKDVCEARGIPLACHTDDVDAMEGRRPVQEAGTDNPINKLIQKMWQGPPYKVSRQLSEGDEVGEFRVVHTPGHQHGHCVFFRERDRVAICGDVVRNMSYLTTLPGIKEPPKQFTIDPAENRRSIRKLAELNPTLLLPGHGPAITDMSEFDRFVTALPTD